MYSPKIPEHLIPALYQLGRERQEPMTRLVAWAVAEYLDREQEKEQVSQARQFKLVA